MILFELGDKIVNHCVDTPIKFSYLNIIPVKGKSRKLFYKRKTPIVGFQYWHHFDGATLSYLYSPHVHTYVCMRAAPKNFFAGVEKCKQFAHFDKCHLILIVSSTVYTYELYIFYIYVGLIVHVAVFECDENDKLFVCLR